LVTGLVQLALALVVILVASQLDWWWLRAMGFGLAGASLAPALRALWRLGERL
jgi:hypothetical protein